MACNVPSSSSIIFVIWSLVNNIPFAFPSIIGDTELGHICDLAHTSKQTPFTIQSHKSRESLVRALIMNTSSLPYDGFEYESSAYPDPKQRCYGLALCRGDVSLADCKTCVKEATFTLISSARCPDSTSAIIWRNNCFFKYSYADFKGVVDTDNSNVTFTNGKKWNVKNSEDAVKKFLSDLIKVAVAIGSPKHMFFYSMNSVPLPRGEVAHSVYGMAQCTRDLGPDQCIQCLNIILKIVPTSKQSGHVVCGSCNLRFETKAFF